MQLWYEECRADAQITFPESGRGLGHVTPTIFGSTIGYPSDSLASCHNCIYNIIIAGKKWLASSVEVYIIPGHGSKVKTREECIKVLTHTWSILTCRHDARYLWLQLTQSATPETVLEAASHKLSLNGLSFGTFVSPGAYHSHWKSPFCTTAETWTNATEDTDSESDDDDSSSTNRLSALFEHDTESLSISWKQSESTQWRMEIIFDSLADRVLVVSMQDHMAHLFLFLANQPKIYRGKPPPYQRAGALKFHYLLDTVNVSETVWERDCCFESCDHRTFGSCNVLHLKLPTATRILSSLIRRLELADFTVFHGSPVITDIQKTDACLQWPTFPTFDASYAWFCLQTRGFKVSDQASSDEFTQLLNRSANCPHIDRVLEAVAARVDDWLILDLKQAFEEELERLEKEGGASEDGVLKPVGDQFISIRRLLITPTRVRGLSAQWCVGNRVVRHYGSDRFIRVIIRDEDLSLLSAANRLHNPIRVITDFIRRDLVIADRRYHFLGCSNSQLREHGLWLYAGDGQPGHTVEDIRRWMGDLSQERCVATYMSRLGQFFSASRNTTKVEQVELISDVQNSQYCFTDGIGKISPLLAKKVTARRNV